MKLEFSGKLWRWQGDAPAAWHLVTLPGDIAGQVRFVSGKRKGFGSVRIKATVGATSWKTSLFSDRKSGSYLLPIKADVRKAEALADGRDIHVVISLDV